VGACHESGAALIDVVVAASVLVVLAGIAVPALHRMHEHAHVLAATRYLSARLHAARFEAIRRNHVVAVHVDDEEAGYAFTLVRDGNGNGVLQRDIDLGIDIPLAPPDRLDHHFSGVTFRVRADVPDIDGAGMLGEGSDPVRTGRSALISFNPIGGCTSGTLYVAGQHGPQGAVRLLGATGRIRAMWFDDGTGQWRAD
jgi:hypothetical protein